MLRRLSYSTFFVSGLHLRLKLALSPFKCLHVASVVRLSIGTAFLALAQMGDIGTETILHPCLFSMMDKIVALNLLSSLPRMTLESIGSEIASIAVSRVQLIRTILQELAVNTKDGKIHGDGLLLQYKEIQEHDQKIFKDCI